MKKHYLLVTLLFSGITSFSQSLSSADIGYTAGESFTMYASDYVNPETSGTGVTWDLSSMTNNNQVSVTVTANSGGTFPSATTKLTQSDGSILYYKITSSIMELVGIDASGIVFSYSNPETHLQFPLTTSTNFTDQSACDFTVSGFNFSRTGSIQSEYSGTGTLITPAGTFTNVMRIKSTMTNTDTYIGGTSSSSIVSYNWYKAGIHHELASVSDITGATTDQAAYYTNVPENLGLEENQLINLSLFPNPSANLIHISSDEVISKVELYKLSGELMLDQSVNDTSSEINISDLNSGMYLMKVYGKDGSVSVQRIMKS
ncbi:T9SS type A sorting domain-containing protein [Fluviicola sp.]|jgi:hypothetical protein|uniref:T9SS type A sorting domain-containing protein n=1 Tax=Fluviicola sp. TaxID=1917219 RepID=UPI00281872C3|nr:T9SS type A sorting domain-containing protein [Fluviicola sp.]MDR0801260.1 T9SS type A sorting domain-containing protein [Fluviicola sp.]